LAPEQRDVPRFLSIYLAQPHEISVEVLVGATEMFHDYPQVLDGSAPVLGGSHTQAAAGRLLALI
jgi:hypothetical protein